MSLLLSVIAFFLKLLIQDFRQLKNQLQVLRESVIRIEQEQSWIKTLLESSRKKMDLLSSILDIRLILIHE